SCQRVDGKYCRNVASLRLSMVHDHATETAEAIVDRVPGGIDAGLVLGSGLGALSDWFEQSVVIPYEELPHMPATTVAGHTGKLLIGKLGGLRTACFQGRFHAYEGHDL